MTNNNIKLTRKERFKKNIDKLTTKLHLQLKFKGFLLTKSYETNDEIFLSYESTISKVKCKSCNTSISRFKGYRYTYPLVGKYNSQEIIASFKKKMFYCEKCNCSTGQKNEAISDGVNSPKVFSNVFFLI